MRGFYFTILDLLKKGKNPSTISKELKVSKQKVNYYLRQLKNEGKLIKKGYGVWEVKEVKTLTSNTLPKRPKEIRGHAFIWTVKIPKKIHWQDRLKSESFTLIRGLTPRIIVKGCKVWLGKKTITVYVPHSFYGRSSVESRKYAVINLLEILGLLESKLSVNLRPYVFKPSREHYGMIKNDLAIQHNRKGEKLHIHDNLEGEWLWIDDSLSLGELETKDLSRSLQVQNWWNDHKKHNFQVSPSFLLESISGIVQVQQMNADNIVKHQRVLDEMSETLKLIRDGLTKKGL